jgi:hypothetical protein
MQDARQVVGHPLHPQAMQIDTDVLRCETPTPGDRKFGLRSAARGRVIVRVGKGTD